MSPLIEACSTLNDRLVLAECIGQSFDAIDGTNAPPWVFVYQTQIAAIREAAEALEVLVRQRS